AARVGASGPLPVNGRVPGTVVLVLVPPGPVVVDVDVPSTVGGTVSGGDVTVISGIVVGVVVEESGTEVVGAVVSGTEVLDVVEVVLVVVAGTGQVISMSIPAEKTSSGPRTRTTSTWAPRVSSPWPTTSPKGSSSTPARTRTSLPDVTIRSLPGWTDPWFSARATTRQVRPRSSSGTTADPR